MFLFILCLSAHSADGHAQPWVSIRLPDLGNDFFQASGLEIQLADGPMGSPMALTVRMDNLQFKKSGLVLSALTLACGSVEVTGPDLGCANGRLTLSNDKSGPLDIPLRFSYTGNNASLRLDLGPFELFSGEHFFKLEGRFFGDQPAGRVDFNMSNLDLAKVGPLLPLLSDFAVNGLFRASGKIQLGSAGRLVIEAALAADELSFSAESGLQAGEGLAMIAEISAKQGADKSWSYQVKSAINAGVTYFDPVYVDLSAGAMEAQAKGKVGKNFQALEIESFVVNHREVFLSNGSALFKAANDWMPGSSQVELQVLDLGKFYATYLAPFGYGTALGELNIDGELSATAQFLPDGAPGQLNLNLKKVTLADATAGFALSGIDALIRWTSDAETQPFRLSWQGGSLYQLRLGAAELSGVLQKDLLLLPYARLPVLDGALEITDLEVSGLFSEDLGWQASARIAPLSMEALTKALEWPTMFGSLSGDIPGLRFQSGQSGLSGQSGNISVDGTIKLDIFDGSAEIRNLQLTDLFGLVPILQADLKLDNLDLEAITKAFDFGAITGRIEGRVENLRLEEWELVEMEALFKTPDGDSSRHRISQKAVDDLTSLNGGLTGALQRSLLRYFEEFSYQKLGISCRLSAGVCQMNGIESKGDAYYIVKGGGWWPRIDVIGINRQVLWPELLRRLQAVSNSGPISVE